MTSIRTVIVNAARIAAGVLLHALGKTGSVIRRTFGFNATPNHLISATGRADGSALTIQPLGRYGPRLDTSWRRRASRPKWFSGIGEDC